MCVCVSVCEHLVLFCLELGGKPPPPPPPQMPPPEGDIGEIYDTADPIMDDIYDTADLEFEPEG